MPSKTPGLTVIDTGNAAKAAINCLNISRLRKIVNQEIADIKESLIKADNEIKER